MTRLSFDPIGRWFAARSHHGVDDRMTFGIIAADGKVRLQRGLSHARCDGIGAMHLLLPQWGARFIAPPDSREQRAPTLGELIAGKPWQRDAQGSKPQWRFGRGGAPSGPDAVQALVLSAEQSAALKAESKRRGVSLLALLLWAEHRMVMQQLCRNTDGGAWFVPVNLRGPLALPSHTMNHSAGVYLDLPALVSPEQIHAQLREALQRKQHWWNFFQALWSARLGQRFLNWLYPRIAKPGSCLGSFSMLGDWHVEWPQGNHPDSASLYCCGPGSPAYPVANGVMVTNGRISLALRLDPYLGHDTGTTRQLLQVWRDHLLGLLNESGHREEDRQCRQG